MASARCDSVSVTTTVGVPDAAADTTALAPESGTSEPLTASVSHIFATSALKQYSLIVSVNTPVP